MQDVFYKYNSNSGGFTFLFFIYAFQLLICFSSVNSSVNPGRVSAIELGIFLEVFSVLQYSFLDLFENYVFE